MTDLRQRDSLLGIVGAVLFTATATQAADFNAIGLLNQTEFRAFSEDVASAISYKGLIPAEGLGITGFDISVAATGTEVAHRAILSKAAGGATVPKAVPVVGVRAVKGLPFDIDIGVVQMTLPDTNVRATGGELRWAFVGGSTVLPAVAVRVSGTSLSGVQQLKMRTLSGDISISKGFAFLTPYAGVGNVEVKSSAPGTSLRAETFRMNKGFVGVNLALVPFALGLEADKTGDATSYSVKLALRW
jgi:hypothetical protein